MSQTNIVTRDSWKEILASAVTIFADLEKKGFGSPDMVIGGGTVLMFRFEHRLSKDIDFFMRDVPIGDFSRVVPGMIEAARRFVQDAAGR
jgi:hypothetical protein